MQFPRRRARLLTRITPARRAILVITAACAVWASACFAQAPATQPATQSTPEDGQWTRAAKDYSSTRFSGLDQIKTDNVKDLRVAWTFSTGTTRGHEAAPIVVDSMMYVTTPFPNVLFALDVTSGAIKWKYEPQPEMAAP